MKRPLIVFPMVYEARSTFNFFNEPLKCVLGGRCRFTLSNGTECEALVSGIGCKKSAERVRECVENFCPTDVVLCGFGGACNEDMELGEFVFQSGSAEISKFLSKNGMREGKIAFSEGVADEKAKRKFAEEGYDIVEMESAIFSAALGDDDDFKPVLTHIRCVSDTLKACVPAGVVESGLNLETGGFKFSPLKSILEISKNPASIAAFIRFATVANKSRKIYEAKIPHVLTTLFTNVGGKK